MKLLSHNFVDSSPIPAEFAFGKPGTDTHGALSANRNPHLAWFEVPENTKSFVIICVDSDAPTRGDDVNQGGRVVPASLPRTDFIHWVMIDIRADCREIAEGGCSNGITPHGKQQPSGPPYSKQGLNDYTGWFAGDPDMAGDYFGYDGPCPPWNDELVHHYHFRLYALDVSILDLQDRFTATDAMEKMKGHILATAELTGTYSFKVV